MEKPRDDYIKYNKTNEATLLASNERFINTFHKHIFSSVQFNRSVVSDSLRPHESHARPPCPSPSPRVHSNSNSSVYISVFLKFHLMTMKLFLHFIISKFKRKKREREKNDQAGFSKETVICNLPCLWFLFF